MDKLIITQSLLSSWSYLYSCYEDSQEDAYNDFLLTLRKEPKEQTDAMLAGIMFENEVYKVVRGESRAPHEQWESGIQAVAARLSGASIQVKGSVDIVVDEQPIHLYGILDALKMGVIYDVKFTTKSFTSAELAGKYLNSPQHPAYMRIVPEAMAFTYLVSDGSDLYTETYRRNEYTPIDVTIRDFLHFLKETELMPIYQERWKAQ
jgi:hypothetical protein